HGAAASAVLRWKEVRARVNMWRWVHRANAATLELNARTHEMVQIARETPIADVRDQTVDHHAMRRLAVFVAVLEFLAGLPTGWEAQGGIDWRQLGQLDGLEYLIELVIPLLTIFGWAGALAAIAVLMGESLARLFGSVYALWTDRSIALRMSDTAITTRKKLYISVAMAMLALGVFAIGWMGSGALRSLALSTGSSAISEGAGAAIGLAIALGYAAMATFHFGWPAAVRIDRLAHRRSKLFKPTGEVRGRAEGAIDKAENASRRVATTMQIGDVTPALNDHASVLVDRGGSLTHLRSEVGGYTFDISMPKLIEIDDTPVRFQGGEEAAPYQLSLLPDRGAATVRAPRNWGPLFLALAMLALLALPVVVAARGLRDSNGPDALGNGVSTQVVPTVSGSRTRATQGLCEVSVRDSSTSVTVDIDPDGQINVELADLMGALGQTASAADIGSVVVFSDTASTEGPDQIDDPRLSAFLRRSHPASGTNFDAALEAAVELLDRCAARAVRHLTLTTDGFGDVDLDVLPADVRVDVIAVNGTAGWAAVADVWAHPNIYVHPVDELIVGAVAAVYGDEGLSMARRRIHLIQYSVLALTAVAGGCGGNGDDSASIPDAQTSLVETADAPGDATSTAGGADKSTSLADETSSSTGVKSTSVVDETSTLPPESAGEPSDSLDVPDYAGRP
ncbi:unnamed protein product, partial [Symbiodinium sp. KB8]